MYTINRGVNGWYGSVTTPTLDEARVAARELAGLLAELREAAPKAQGLNDAGLACLDYCEANPACKHDEYTKAGHTLSTVKWLMARGYLGNAPDKAWIVDREGKLPVAEPKAKRPKR